MIEMEMKNAWTYFIGFPEDAADFADEWSMLLGSRVEYKLVNNPLGPLDTYRFEAQVTQEQVDEYDMNSDWVVNL
jgi:hypothetical protein